jgi:PAS domain S-box-containing protein
MSDETPRDCELANETERRRLRLFGRITRLLASSREPDEVLDLVVREGSELLGMDAATIRLVEPAVGRLHLAAAHNLSPAYLSRGPVDQEKGMAEVMGGRAMAVEDLEEHTRYPEESRREGIRSVVAAPIVMHGTVRGMLRLLSRAKRTFSQSDLDFATALAEQCGIALESARSRKELDRQLSYFRIISEVGKTVNATNDLNEVLDLLLDRIQETMNLKGCTVRLLDPEAGHLELVSARGLSREYLERGSIDDEMSTHRALAGEPAIIADARTDPRLKYHEEARAEGIVSILAAPIIVSGRILGVLRLLTGERRDFGPADVSFVMALAEHGGVAIQNARNFKQIRKLVTELEQHEEFLEQVIHGIGADLFVLDEKDRLLMANHSFLERVGRSEREIVGRSVHEVVDFLLSRQGDPDDGECALDKVRSLQEPAVCQRQVGDAHLDVILSPALTGEGGARYVVGAIRDVTSRVKLEQERLSGEKMKGVLEMAGGAAHELNSPLSSALGLAQVVLDELDDGDDHRADLETIITNLKSMAAITRRMTAITGFETTDYVDDVKIVDLGGGE